MTPFAKVMTAVTVGVGGWLMFGGSASASRRPWTQPIRVPGEDGPWDAIDEALCLCVEAEERNPARLVLCVLARVYPEIGWPARKGDHETVGRTQQAVTTHTQAFLAALANGQRPCDRIDPGTVWVPGVPEPEQPSGGKLDDYIGDGPGQLQRIRSGDNPTLTVRRAFDLPVATPNIQRALWCVNGTGFNLYFYSRPVDAGTYGAFKYGAKWFDCGPAYFPWNQNMVAQTELGQPTTRNVSWGGRKFRSGTWGCLWIPDMADVDNELHCIGDDPWDPKRNPPRSALDLLGLPSLPEMREAWEAGAL